MKYYSRCDSPFGPIFLAGDEKGLSFLHFEKSTTARTHPGTADWQYRPDMFQQTEKQLEEYFSGKRRRFSLILNPRGTAFQQRVWEKLCRVPHGQVLSYKELAHQLGMVNGARAVASANGRNPIPVIIPCHRIIGSDGRLVGYAYGEELKRRLLLLEGLDRWPERMADSG